jgi:hypothetical protein
MRKNVNPQVGTKEHSTKTYGGEAPTKDDVIKSANARGGKRHEVKGDDLADMNQLSDTGKMAGNEMVGVKNNGYLTKKDLPYGVEVFYNTLPPGSDIEDQEIADIREMKMKTITPLGYPGDGFGGE